ncbi:ADP-dependent phosphofructokinase/glucokinase [Sphaerochaeta associata]|uniref:ADP-dependent glucokinase/phosphofructokinase n=1 Tax=Sphaerochaeta associata TaxID=1129264 RepID=A0ABY4DDU9_9SPIR|nr:ADP-dependent glucokinase/phosphofructokinase [Sphaerochaeta associata]UOM51117.1 ADP-dependent glucokinase/phosphofructokinase [Sphaerochaeta associata]SMP65932.1 ADP-dependent phosphofructokinase/glucokinase [Sphaerochaeta associata]
MQNKHRIALGFGNNIDRLITMNSSLLQESIDRLHIHGDDIRFYAKLQTEKEVLCTLLDCIIHQKGGEYYIWNPQVLEQLSENFPYIESIGGTAARAANLLVKNGHKVLLHCVSYTDEDKEFIDSFVEVVTSYKNEELRHHYIIQFNQGLQVQVDQQIIIALQSNRIIINNNPVVRNMRINYDFFFRAQDYEVLLLSGFNAIHDVRILETRLLEILNQISLLNKNLTIIYEDGCFHKPAYREFVIDYLCPCLSIYSMNEEELMELVHGPLLTAEQKIQSIMSVRQMLGVPIVIIHTQSYVIACGENALRIKKALQTGVDFATCHLLNQAKIPMNLPYCPEGLIMQKFCEKNDNLCCVPSYAIRENCLTTIGLGDAFIAGLLSVGV